MKYLNILSILLILINSSLFSQCLCGKLELRIQLKNLEIIDDLSNHSIKIVNSQKFYGTEYYYKISSMNLMKDTLIYFFPTENGIDTMIVMIINDDTKEKMAISFLNMTYDNPYFIDLGIFHPGNYVFDWEKIDKCQTNNPSHTIIECDDMKFFQLQLKDGYFNHNRIKPYNLEYFKKNKIQY